MPYITRSDREAVRQIVEEAKNLRIVGHLLKGAGEINYVLTEIVAGYLDKVGMRYANLNEVIGALECCKLELYRRLAAPYEDQKIKENTDVY